MYLMNYDYLYSLTSIFQFFNRFPSQLHVFFLITYSALLVMFICMGLVPSTEAWQTSQWEHCQSRMILFSLETTNYNSVSIRSEAWKAHLPSMLELVVLLLCATCVSNYSCCELMSVIIMPCPEDCISLHSFPSFRWILHSFCLLLHNLLCALAVYWILTFHSGPSSFCLILTLWQSCISELTFDYWKKKLLWPRLTELQVYGYKLNYLEGNAMT